MKTAVLEVLAILARSIGSAINTASPAAMLPFVDMNRQRSREPGKPGKAGDKIARHAAENRLGIRR